MEKKLIAVALGMLLIGCYISTKEAAERASPIPVYTYSEAETELTVEDKIISVAKLYGINEQLALAIARLETGHFTSDAYVYGNNVGGLSDNELPRSYESLDAGIQAFIENLAVNYISEGLTTPEQIAPKYCPLNAEAWARAVNDLMIVE